MNVRRKRDRDHVAPFPGREAAKSRVQTECSRCTEQGQVQRGGRIQPGNVASCPDFGEEIRRRDTRRGIGTHAEPEAAAEQGAERRVAVAVPAIRPGTVRHRASLTGKPADVLRSGPDHMNTKSAGPQDSMRLQPRQWRSPGKLWQRDATQGPLGGKGAGGLFQQLRFGGGLGDVHRDGKLLFFGESRDQLIQSAAHRVWGVG